MSAESTSDLFAISVKTIDGKDSVLGQFKGRIHLFVNTASKCGYTPQYKGLEALYQKYRERGLQVLGFPSNEFGGQEPGGDAEIKKFCELNFGVKFPLFTKAQVKGAEKQPVYQYLLNHAPAGQTGEIKWNFEKFLVDDKGRVLARFGSSTAPDDPKLIDIIESHLR